jgi:hypothetical protein
MEICGGAKFTAQYIDEQVMLLDSVGSFASERKARGNIERNPMGPLVQTS